MSRNEFSKIVTRVPLALQLGDERVSALKRYRQKVIGDKGWVSLFLFELITMMCLNLQGGAGYLLRKKILGLLFKKVGPGIILGRGISLRHPDKITLGRNVAIDDNVLLDASGAENEGIVLGDEVIISRNCVIQGKTGSVSIGAHSDIGSNTVISSVSGIYIGRDVLIAGNCYLGGALHIFDRPDIPIMDQGSLSNGPLHVEDGVWLGAGVIVLDGVKIGRGCVVGAGAVVTKDLPDNVVATGMPAKVMRYRVRDCD